MRTIKYLIQKEFIQILRDRTMLPIIIVLPFVQLIILVYASTFDIKNIDMVIVDQDQSALSRQLVSKFEGSPFFTLYGSSFSIKEANDLLTNDEVDVILHIPNDFEKNLLTGQNPDLQLLINAINSTAAGLINAYSNYVIADFNRRAITENINYIVPKQNKNINVIYSFWYNPELNYQIYMLPGILVVLVTIIGAFLAALNIVREKEMGTIEQINVTPIQKYHFIIGKLVPFWIIAMMELGLGLTIGRILFDVPIIGSLWVLFGFAGAYLLVALGAGLLISTMANTQQQVMFIIFFFLLTFILMSGIFTPVESMPHWAQKVNILNPFAYFMRVIRMILLKGSGFSDITKEFFSLLIYASILLSLAVWRYRKTA
jgi:ABC-2 type transport system permease protein